MKLSKFTIGFALYIVISASFMRQVWDFLNKIAGAGNVRIACLLLFIAVAVLMLIRIIKYRLGFLRIIVNLIILSLAFALAWQQPFFTERIHVLEYGFLGWLATKDLNKNKNSIRGILSAIIFVFFIGILDEIFQKYLPYRVGEIRDAVTNLVSGGFGVILFLFG